MYTVYKHTAPNGKVYIGITKQNPPSKRWLGGQGYRTQEKFYRAILKYGWKNFKHEILYQYEYPEEAEEMERKLIKQYRSTENEFGYNVEHGGNYKKEISEETREKSRNARKTKQYKERIAQINKKRWSDPKAHELMREKFSGDKNPMYGKKLSDKHREILIAEARKHIDSQKKPVLCIETGVIYESISEAGRCTVAKASCIALCCKGIQKSAGKLHWKYANA